MFTLHSYAIFMIGAIALNLTPGPDMAFILAQSISRGTKAGLTAALGIGCGCLIHITVAALGLAALLAAWPLAFTVIRYVGAAYLIWIAFNILRHPVHFREAEPQMESGATFRQGMLTNLMNPKVVLFFIAILPQFVAPGHVPAGLQLFLLGLSFNLSGTIVGCLVALGSGNLADRLRHTLVIGKILNAISASVMCLLALRLLQGDKA